MLRSQTVRADSTHVAFWLVATVPEQIHITSATTRSPTVSNAGQDAEDKTVSHAPSGAHQLGFPQAQDMSSFPDATHDLLFLSDLLPSKAKLIQEATRAFMVRQLMQHDGHDAPHDNSPQSARICHRPRALVPDIDRLVTRSRRWLQS